FTADHGLMPMERIAANVIDIKHGAGWALEHRAFQLRRSVHLVSADAGDDVIALNVGILLKWRVRKDIRDPHPDTVGVLPGGESSGSHAGENQQEHEDAHLAKSLQVLSKKDADQHQAD